MVVMSSTHRLWVLVAGLCAAELACSGNPAADPALDPALLPPGEGLVWLASTEPAPSDPKQPQNRELIEVEGKVTALDAGDLRAPADWRMLYGGQYQPVKQVVTIRSSSGGVTSDWKLGYQLTRAAPTTDVTPPAPLAVGSNVRLRFRAIWAFGTAPAFVLSDDAGVALAIDLATYGDPYQPGDVPGLAVVPGSAVGVVKGNCGDQKYSNLRFEADAPIELRQNAIGAIAINHTSYTAFHLFNFTAAPTTSGAGCPDAINEGRAWAIWRGPR